MKKPLSFLGALMCIILLFNNNAISQTYTWTGVQDTVFFNSANWDGLPSATDLKTAWRNYVIPNGTANYPAYTENVFGKSGTVQAEQITVDAGALFKIYSYTIYTNYATVNGNLILSNGSLNIRKAAATSLFTNGNAVLNMTGSSLNTKYALNLANGTGNLTANLISSTISTENNNDLSLGNSGTSTATINVKQAGRLASARNLIVGANTTINLTSTATIDAVGLTLNGSIKLAGLATITLAGNQKTAMEALVTGGKISSSEGKAITVTYDAASDKTNIVSGSSMQWVRKEGAFIVLTNGVVTAKIEETTSKLKSFVVNGTELLAQTNAGNANRVGAYHDFTYGSDDAGGFEVIANTLFSIKEVNEDYIDISFKKTYSGTGIPLDVDIHYVLKKDDNALYTYNILSHPASYPQTDIGSWRQVFWIANDGSKFTTEKIFVTEQKKWEMPSLTDTWQPTAIAEIIKYTSGVKAGKYDGKYEYTENLMDIPAYGFASDINKVGLFAVLGSHEYFNGGPTHNDLNAAAGIIHVCMNGVHYGDAGYSIAAGEEWSKIYGPYLLYAPTETTAEANWIKAKERAVIEKAQWPYSWLTNTPEYPLANARGHVKGKLTITDGYKPSATGANAWVGLTNLSPGNTKGWEMEAKNYQYWVKTDANGNFDISARPGTYTLYAYSNGVLEEFKMTGVNVTAGTDNNLGNLDWNLLRTKTLLWEVGVADRSTAEYKLGDLAYSQGFIHEKFRSLFSPTIEYNVAAKNWSDILPYVHARYPLDDAATDFTPWVWHFNFNLPANFNPNSGGAVDLNVGFASNAKAQYWIYVNNRDRSGSPTFAGYPEGVESNTYIRQANHGKYSYKIFSIARNKLKAGANTITFVMPSGNGNVSHVMYDYISLSGDNSMLLPVTLSKFSAKKDGNYINISWATAHEENADKYIVERADENANFVKIAEIPALNKPSSYSYNDKQPFAGINYYRLIQRDFDGKETVFEPKSVYMGVNPDNVFEVSVSREGNINIQIKDLANAKKIALIDVNGKLLWDQQVNSNSISINGSNFSKGIYLVRLEGAYENFIKKIVL
ncbi:hypothetical protein BCY91_11410 [Pelobium manganitolerans]|uniref:rhamnogalacturonan endolyase n=1 Tax=Pelobium manganitolerans TaxID=1842495 RepID=A0A419S294_9SPHI|nr:polysaccharide lyase family protein [Pelobium manganitolerans]RKD12844.1 hypothetical protein BCY91_11410 [Pelobium manganitolerans]